MNTLSHAERRIVNLLVAKAFANRRGHGHRPSIVHRQMSRDDLTAVLVDAVKETKKLRDHVEGREGS